MAPRIPTHPGEIVLYDCLEPLGMSLEDGAEALGVERDRLAAITDGRASITAEEAIRLSKAFGGTAKHWYQMQANHDLWHAENSAERISRSSAGRRRVDDG